MWSNVNFPSRLHLHFCCRILKRIDFIFLKMRLMWQKTGLLFCRYSSKTCWMRSRMKRSFMIHASARFLSIWKRKKGRGEAVMVCCLIKPINVEKRRAEGGPGLLFKPIKWLQGVGVHGRICNHDIRGHFFKSSADKWPLKSWYHIHPSTPSKVFFFC